MSQSDFNVQLLVYFDFVGTYGGAQKSTSVLLNKLHSDYHHVFDVKALMAPGASFEFVDSLKCPVFFLPKLQGGDIFKARDNKVWSLVYLLLCAWHVYRFLSRQQNRSTINLLCNSPKALFVLSVLKIILPKVNLVYYCRGWGRPSDFNWISRRLLTWCVDKVLCVSRQTSINISGFVRPAEKIKTTYTSVSFEDLISSDIKSPLSDSNKISVLYAGAIIPAKGIHTLIEAISQMVELQRNKIFLQIAGNHLAPGVFDYFNLCNQLANDNNIQLSWLGWRSDIPDLIARADIVCLPSFSEGMPRIVQEGMYMRRIVVAARVGGVPDLVLDGITGFSFESGDVSALHGILIGIVNNKVDPISMGDAAKQHVVHNFGLDSQTGLVVDAIICRD